MEFQSTVHQTSYETTITVDCAVFGFADNELKALLVKRKIDPFKGYWMLPGGVMEEGITLEEAIKKILFSLTGITDIHYQQVKAYSDLNRHPVKRVVTICFYALIKPENHPVTAKNYVSEVDWFSWNEKPDLGFDHCTLLDDAYIKLRQNMKEQLLFGELLPEKFTLKELQDLYESILGETLDRRNFRKKILQQGILKNTGEKKQGVKGGPELFKIEK